MKIIYTLFFTLLAQMAFSQVKIDISFLPKAIYTEKYWSLDRWASKLGNIIHVELRTDSLGKLTFSPCLIETTLEKNKATYILFPSSGTETDIYIYELFEYSDKTMDVGDSVLKKNIIMWGADDMERAIQIDDLAPGYYYVRYISCNYGGYYILQIKEKDTP